MRTVLVILSICWICAACANRLSAADQSLATGAWSPAGSGFNSTVWHLAPYDGQVIAGGDFTMSGATAVVALAGWNGSAWAPFGTGITGGNAGPMIQFGADLYVGGTFSQAGGVSTSNLARWDGSAWHDASSAAFTNPTDGITVHQGSLFTTAGNTIYQLVGSTWQAIGTADDRVRVFSDPLGLIVAGHISSVSGVPVAGYALWNGTSWSDLGNGLAQAGSWLEGQRAIRYQGTLIAVGEFDIVESSLTTGHHVAWWDGAAWHALGGGLVGQKAICAGVLAGDLVVGGVFTTAGGTSAANLAWWDGATWHAFGSGANGTVCDAIALDDRLWIGGGFSTINGVSASMVAVFSPTPVITSPLAASGKQDHPFTYQITAAHGPESFAAIGLPPGLVINTNSGRITGTPQSTGVTTTTISATNAGGSDMETLTITVSEPAADSQDDGILNTGIGPSCGAGTGMSIILSGLASLGLLRRRRD